MSKSSRTTSSAVITDMKTVYLSNEPTILELGSDEVHVKVEATMVKQADLVLNSQIDYCSPKKSTYGMGSEAVGTIVRVGSPEHTGLIGSKVGLCKFWNSMGAKDQGCWRELITCSVSELIFFQSDIKDELAVQALLEPFCIFGLLDYAETHGFSHLMIDEADSRFGRILSSVALS